jgi:hypothetical protein
MDNLYFISLFSFWRGTMSDFTKKGSIVFGLIMFGLGVGWVFAPYAVNWGPLVVLWVGIGCLGYSVSKYSNE